VQVIIDQMPMYKGIKTLVITTEKPMANPNLLQILTNARSYPLEDLYIINFGPSLTSLPSTVGDFPKLKTLEVYNNGLGSLPASVSQLAGLSSLQIQDNPISTLMPMIGILKNLKDLGISLTKLSENEISLIQKTLPECKITRQ
jgi:Leucine-rich repeat (LRR) protein